MKKTIEKTFCDDCGKEIPANKPCTTIEIIKHKSPLGDNIGILVDFCCDCLTWRVNHSISIVNTRRCLTCKGTGAEKEWTGFGSDYEYKKCDKCKGKGIIE